MRMLLEEGCDPDDEISDNMWDDGSGMNLRRKQFNTPLHQAARGDDQMIKLLLGFSARIDIKSRSRGNNPAERAMSYHRVGTASKLNGQ